MTVTEIITYSANVIYLKIYKQELWVILIQNEKYDA
jgi:hypothetical protein